MLVVSMRGMLIICFVVFGVVKQFQFVYGYFFCCEFMMWYVDEWVYIQFGLIYNVLCVFEVDGYIVESGIEVEGKWLVCMMYCIILVGEVELQWMLCENFWNVVVFDIQVIMIVVLFMFVLSWQEVIVGFEYCFIKSDVIIMQNGFDVQDILCFEIILKYVWEIFDFFIVCFIVEKQWLFDLLDCLCDGEYMFVGEMVEGVVLVDVVFLN